MLVKNRRSQRLSCIQSFNHFLSWALIGISLAYSSLFEPCSTFQPPTLALGDCDNVAVRASYLFPPPPFSLPHRATLAVLVGCCIEALLDLDSV